MSHNLKWPARLPLLLVCGALLYNNCSPSSSGSSGGNDSPQFFSGQVCTPGSAVNAAAVNSKSLTISANDANAMPVTIGCGYVDQPCVSVTVCTPGTNGTSNCQTIPNLLLDTGSYGLRIFDNATTTGGATFSTKNLNAVPNLYECISYVDGSYQWGQVMKADVVMGTQVAGSVPIQVVAASPTTETPNVPAACVNQQGGPGTADVSVPGSYNGILGVGLFTQDCGPTCVTAVNNQVYFTCTGNNCTGSTVSLANQVANPVSSLPANYNNGVIVQLPNVPDTGATTASGFMVLGIGTVANNTPPPGVTTLQASSQGNFQTQFGTQSFSFAFIDSGSNGIFFPNGCLATDAGGFFIPNSEVGFSAEQSSYNSSKNSVTIKFNSFNINGAPASNMVYNDLTGDMDGAFDWGLPFFLGRTIYVGIEAKKSSLGTGPYWAY